LFVIFAGMMLLGYVYFRLTRHARDMAAPDSQLTLTE
jgi:cbb3-type cytochrome oxidase subunit 3